ncbi:hypothetical protein C2E23DRAFT_736739 [Lenzites betulinus]|nr:hypothetical protein C2E23DRAFT_736739 [Lenzites betulinus]
MHSFIVVAAYTHSKCYPHFNRCPRQLDISNATSTGRIEQKCVTQRPEERANVALLRHGLLGSSPVYPEVAFSLDTLELYHRLRRHHPQLGIQPMARALCDLHNVNYTKLLRTQMSSAFDIYLNILQIARERCDFALGRRDSNWRLSNSCPCCHIQLEGEPALHPARLVAMDGNNSAKRVASAGAQDKRIFKSSYFLSREVVDQFKDEVKKRPEDDAPWAPIGDEGGDVTDGQTRTTSCAEHWKASAAENLKRALDIYETTGIFVSACRHGFIQIACEMVRSGELAKYPLALLNHTLDVLGDHTAFGYDIGCTFKETVARSKLVGPKAAACQVLFAVCAFHGYAHNRQCQLANHPLYLVGFGLEDLEGLERVFSGSNPVARLIRYASKYHWMQALDLHFRHWDEEKYAELSMFLYNNVRQSLTIIRDYSIDVKHLQAELNITDADIEGWVVEEREFLSGLKDEPEERVLEVAYVQALLDRAKADDKAVDYHEDSRRTNQLEAVRRTALHALNLANSVVGDFEKKLAIRTTWTPVDKKYQETLSYLRHREYHRALDRVQHLVMQRLLELSKANMSGTSYKARTAIWKALKTRGKAIRTALKKYNALALQMSPRAPSLQWKDVVTYTFVGEFDLLRNAYSRRDILTALWTTPRNREIAVKYFKTVRAREELKRADVELRRLETSIELERREYELAIRATAPHNAVLAAELRAQLRSRRRVQAIHVARIGRIRALPGYSGVSEMCPPSGVRHREVWDAGSSRGTDEDDTSTAMRPDGPLDDDTADMDDVFSDPAANDEMIRMTEVMEIISLDR